MSLFFIHNCFRQRVEDAEVASSCHLRQKERGSKWLTLNNGDNFVEGTPLVHRRTKKKARQLVSPFTELKSSTYVISPIETPPVTNYDNEDKRCVLCPS